MLKVLGAMFLAMPFATSAFASAPSVPNVLYAAHYSPGLMEKVAARRNMQRVDCMISSPWHPLNTWIRIESQKNGEVAYCRTTDVSAPRDQARHKRLQIIELDWGTAKRLCNIQRVRQSSPRSCPVQIEVISEQAAVAALAPPEPPTPEATPPAPPNAPAAPTPQPPAEAQAPTATTEAVLPPVLAALIASPTPTPPTH